jgi:hypothetical protein
LEIILILIFTKCCVEKLILYNNGIESTCTEQGESLVEGFVIMVQGSELN